MIELLNGSQPCPDRFLKDSSGAVTTNLNPEFQIWKSKEKALLTFISSTLSPATLAFTLTFDELTTLLNAEEESLTESVEIKDAFALAANARPANINFSHSNQSRGRGKYNNTRGGGRGRGNGASHANDARGRDKKQAMTRAVTYLDDSVSSSKRLRLKPSDAVSEDS
nr:hypothetical protein CFP56_77415 [Quercus suber]